MFENLDPKKFRLVIIVLAVFIVLEIVGLGCWWWRGQQERYKAPFVSPSPLVVPTPRPAQWPFPTQIPSGLVSSSKEIMKEILAFINSQKNPDGFYNYVAHYEEQCREEGGRRVCPFGGTKVFPVTNGWVTLGRLSAYQAFQEESYLDDAKGDTEKLLTFCQKDPKECLWVLVQPVKLYEAAPDEKLLDFLKDSGELLLNTSQEASMLIEIEARELALLYDLTKDERFLSEAKKRLEFSKKNPEDSRILFEIRGTQVPADACWYTLGALSIYKVSGEEGYLKEVEDYVQKIELDGNYTKFDPMSSLQPCAETLQELSQTTQKEIYANLSSEILLFMLQNNWDSKYTSKFYGEGMILATKDSPMNVLTDSAYMIYLLSRDLSLSFPLSK